MKTSSERVQLALMVESIASHIESGRHDASAMARLSRQFDLIEERLGCQYWTLLEGACWVVPGRG
jgi:hypothetical protein